MLRCAISYPTIQCECNPPTSSPIRKYLQDYRCRAIRKNPVYPKCANYHPSAWSPNSQVLLSNMNSMKDHYFDRVHFGSNHPDNKRCNELKQFEDWIEKNRASYKDMVGTLFQPECCCLSIPPARRIQQKYCF
ncbi:hypothetical protein EGR_08870 [Echinococcus granulosus]|uniref:Uncharacterized protein n=1 Tax=Echinococcus granulosus TaxID=6210 RepID=W6U549_ECHGR|nr:hypothetical protein EGR_08870 [Echinococcus granulosus]EUB56255.1 hypothetical protein EGR_08870 [Echinococcus granulosus]